MNYDAINDMVGKPWVYLENDCWAVFREGSKRIFGREIKTINLPDVSDTNANVLAFLKEKKGGDWQEVDEPMPGDAVVFYDKRGNFNHIALYIEHDNILHCVGTPKQSGMTRYEKLSKLNTFIYRSHEFYRCLA